MRNPLERHAAMPNSTDSLIALIIGILGAAVIIKIVEDAAKKKRYECPNCANVVRKGSLQCPECKTLLRWA